MEVRRRILIIENQYTQFDTIVKRLEEYDLYPTQDLEEYKYFLDLVRINLNPRYSLGRRNNVFEKILEKFEKINPELLIIDHVLVGNHSAENGIELAIKLRENNILAPIIFLSRTEPNNVEVCSNLPKVNGKTFWIYKGYSGKGILEKKFFEHEVLPKIKEFLHTTPLERSVYRIETEILPYLTELNNIHIEANARLEEPARSSSLNHLKKLIDSFNKYINEDKIIPDVILDEFTNIIKITESATFGSIEWDEFSIQYLQKIEK